MDIEISESVREVIDAYIGQRQPLSLGYESHGIQTFADECKKFFDDFNWKRILKIKHECCQYSKRDELKYYMGLEEKSKDYFDGMNNYRFVWSKGMRGFRGYFSDYIESSCMRYFTKNIMTFVNPYIEYTYGSLENAIRLTETFVELWNGFELYFDKKRKEFMEKMEIDIAKVNQITKKKSPQSHGAVANLLKILTKTMHEQGADIRSIAKVQYAVCTQAGIYIPDEFIRDVAVALDIDNEVSDGN